MKVKNNKDHFIFRYIRFHLLLFFFMSLSNISCAHTLSTSFLNIKPLQTENTTQTSTTMQLFIGLQDLQSTLYIDPDNDGLLQWKEVISKKNDITAFVLDHLKFTQAGGRCTLQLQGDLKIKSLYLEEKLVIPLYLECNNSNKDFIIHYESPEQLRYKNHKLLVLYGDENISTQFFLDKEKQNHLLNLKTSNTKTFFEYVKQGIVHILIGYDHILFLMCLVLPFGRYSPGRHNSFKYIIACITGFTLAHSITIALSLNGIQPIPAHLIEVLIAISVALAAFNIIKEIFKSIFIVSLFFGLIHGYGFGGALKELGLPFKSQGIALAGFNIGVELGQIMLLSFILPALYFMRIKLKNKDTIINIMAGIILMIGVYWTISRI